MGRRGEGAGWGVTARAVQLTARPACPAACGGSTGPYSPAALLLGHRHQRPRVVATGSGRAAVLTAHYSAITSLTFSADGHTMLRSRAQGPTLARKERP